MHFTGNIEMQLEFNQAAELVDVVELALTKGSPILAPGILFLSGALGVLATYYHPVLQGAAD